eukprot:1282774-Pyramimonas_sp.AAC.1
MPSHDISRYLALSHAQLTLSSGIFQCLARSHAIARYPAVLLSFAFGPLSSALAVHASASASERAKNNRLVPAAAGRVA